MKIIKFRLINQRKYCEECKAYVKEQKAKVNN